MSYIGRPRNKQPWLQPGWTFSLQPPWPPEFEPMPYEPKTPHPMQLANLKKGRSTSHLAPKGRK